MNTHDIDLATEIWAAAQKGPGEGMEDAIERIAQIIEADRKCRGSIVNNAYASSEPVAWQHRFRMMPDGDWNEWKEGRAPKLRGDSYGVQERPLFTAPQPAESSRGEPVAEIVLGEDGIQIETIAGSPLRLGDKLYSAPQPADPVKVPSDDEIIELRSEFDWREHYGNIRFARALLARYGQPSEPEKDAAGYTLGPISDGEMDPRNEQSEPVNVPSDDVLADALSNLEHDNYEQSYSGYKNRQADIGLIRAAIDHARRAEGGNHV